MLALATHELHFSILREASRVCLVSKFSTLGENSVDMVYKVVIYRLFLYLVKGISAFFVVKSVIWQLSVRSHMQALLKQEIL